MLVLLAVAAALVSVCSFVLYGRSRMREEQQKEKRYLQIHYTSLFLLLLLGIVFMFFMVETSD